MFDIRTALIAAVVAVLVLGNIGTVWKLFRGSGQAKNPFAGATKTIEGALGHLGGKPSTKGETIDTLESLRGLLLEQGVVTAEVTSAIDVIELAVLHPKAVVQAAPSQSTGA